MKFIRNLFVKNIETRPTPEKTIYDFFSFSLRYVPDFSYEKICEQVSKNGDISTLYSKRLNYLECGLFDTIEVKVYDHFGHKSISMIRNDVDKISLLALERLVKACYECYGPDDSQSGRGILDEADKTAIRRKQWSGRMWTNAHHKPGAMILLDNERLEMVIWLKDTVASKQQ